MFEKLNLFNKKYNLRLYFPSDCSSHVILNNSILTFKRKVKEIIELNSLNAPLLKDLNEVVKEVKEFIDSTRQHLADNTEECHGLKENIIDILESI